MTESTCEEPRGSRLTRRGSLLTLGGAVAAAVAGAAWRPGAGRAAGAASCVLTPELSEGPYYVPDERLRRDITEGKPGTPLTLRLAVVDASTCRPVKGAAVDIWHCDAGGAYSGFTTRGNFLRGIQRTDARGVATFRTIYPGWYSGRAVHVHLKVHVGGDVVHTGQLFFPGAVTDAVYRRSPYSRRPGPDVRNADDSIFRSGGARAMLTLRRSGAGYVGSVTTGVAS